MITIKDVARYIIVKYQYKKSKRIDEMKLHQILYLAQKEYLRIYHKPMFKEQFEGWKFGPVNIDVRKMYKHHNYRDKSKFNQLSKDECNIIDNLIDQYIDTNPWELGKIVMEDTGYKNSRKNIKDDQNGKVKIKTDEIGL